MKKYILILGGIIMSFFQSCVGTGNGAELTTSEGITKTQELVTKHFSKYDGKITTISFSYNSSNVIDVISASYKEGNENKLAIYNIYSDKVDETTEGTKSKGKGLTLSEIDLNLLKTGLEKAKAIVLEKDSNFSDFRVGNTEYTSDEEGNIAIEFEVLARNPNLSYIGERLSNKSDVFKFTFVMDKDQNVKNIKGINI